MYTARIDSRWANFGFNGALRLELRDPTPSRIIGCRQSLEPESVPAAKYFATGYGASIVTKVGSLYRSMARSAGLAKGVNEVAARRSQTAVQGRFWLQGLDPLGFAIYYVAFFGRVASCSKVNRSNYQTDTNRSNSSKAAAPQTRVTSAVLEVVQGPRAIAARSERLARMEARAQRVIEARGQSSSRKHAARSKSRKEASAARRCAKRPV